MLSLKKYSCLLSLSLLLFSSLATTLEQKTALTLEHDIDAMIHKINYVHNSILNALPRIKSSPSSKRTYETLEKIWLPIINLSAMTKNAMAVFYKKATLQQKKKFTLKIQKDFLYTFYNLFMQLVEYKKEYIPIDNHSIKKIDQKSYIVDFKVNTHNKRVTKFQYVMVLNHKNQWVINNLIISDINLGIAMRNEFYRLAQSNNYNLDAVIAIWQWESSKKK